MIAGLPYDAEIEYLESTGTQWIDTGFTSSSIQTIKCECRFEQVPYTTTFGFIIMSRGTSSGVIGAGIPKSNPTQLYNYVWTSTLSQLARLTIGSESIHNLVLWNDGAASHAKLDNSQVNYTISGAQSLTSSIKLFYDDGSNYGTSRIYSFRLDTNGVLVRDFVPVRVGNVGYMYDRVTKRLFGNQGTGAFKLGPDVSKPVLGIREAVERPLSARYYVQKGLVAMWDGIENAGWGVHDPNSNMWVDLSGNGYDLTRNSNAMFTDNALEAISTGKDFAYGSVALPYNDNRYHYEIVCSYDGVFRDSAIMVFTGGGTVNLPSGQNGRNLITLYAWAQYQRKGIVFGNPSTLFKANSDYTFTGIHQGSGTHDFCAYDGVALSQTSFVDGDISKNYKSVITIGYADIATSAYIPAGFRIHTLRIYESRLAESARLANYALDRKRFGLGEGGGGASS